METTNRFNIDFFEFSFLVEACIPPAPIARAMFFRKVINEHYHVLTERERGDLYEWVKRTINFNEPVNEMVQTFLDRYNPYNQYLVTTECNGKVEQTNTFFRNEKYYTGYNQWIADEYITNIENI